MRLTFQTRSPTAEGSQNQPGLLVSFSDSRCAFCTYSLNRLPFFSVCSPLRIASPQISVLIGPAWRLSFLKSQHWPSWMLQHCWKLLSRHLRQRGNKRTWGDDHDINAKGLELPSETLRHCIEAGLAGGVGCLHTLALPVSAII